MVRLDRWQGVPDDGYLQGTPDIVVEVLSRPRERSALCLGTGSLEFWEIDPKTETVEVASRSGQAIEYSRGEDIPLTLFGAKSLSIDQTFL